MSGMSNSKFYGQDNKRYWRGLDEVASVKLLAKMFREITHMKPPRGRQGRLLNQQGHYAVEAAFDNYVQDRFTAEQEYTLLENRNAKQVYNQTYSQDPEKGNIQDLERLQELHTKASAKKRVENTVNGLQDLISGLMGLGLNNINYEYQKYTGRYTATMYLDNFVISIEERSKDD